MRVDARRWLGSTEIAVPPQARRAPQSLPLPEPERRYLPLLDPPQMSDERWDKLGESQVEATALVEAGALEHALQVLAVGTWRNPEEELRKLIIDVCCGSSSPGWDEEGAPTDSQRKEVP